MLQLNPAQFQQFDAHWVPDFCEEAYVYLLGERVWPILLLDEREAISILEEFTRAVLNIDRRDRELVGRIVLDCATRISFWGERGQQVRPWLLSSRSLSQLLVNLQWLDEEEEN